MERGGRCAWTLKKLCDKTKKKDTSNSYSFHTEPIIQVIFRVDPGRASVRKDPKKKNKGTSPDPVSSRVEPESVPGHASV